MENAQNRFIAALREFHRACGYPHSDVPSVADESRLQTWSSLLQEESSELLEALAERNLVKVADGLGDLLYVCVGAALAFGIPLEDVFEEIHRSNMSKISRTSGATQRADGKVLRGDSYSRPDLVSILNRFGANLQGGVHP